MIIDRNLPYIEGSKYVSYLRNKGYDIPIIFLSGKNKETDVIEGFQSGGDDYITKPFSIKELLIRISALLRRSQLNYGRNIRHRDMILNLRNQTLCISNNYIVLTNLEFNLLYIFIKNANRVLHRDFLRDKVWGNNNSTFQDKTINVAINRLNKKIDPKRKKKYFFPIWGVGYKLI